MTLSDRLPILQSRVQWTKPGPLQVNRKRTTKKLLGSALQTPKCPIVMAFLTDRPNNLSLPVYFLDFVESPLCLVWLAAPFYDIYRVIINHNVTQKQ